MSNLMISAHLHNLPTTPLEPQPQVPTHLKMHLNDPQCIVQPTASPFELNSVFQLKHISDLGGSYLQGESCFQAEPYYVVRIAPHVTCAIMITYHTLEVQLLFVLRWTTKITKLTLSCYYKKRLYKSSHEKSFENIFGISTCRHYNGKGNHCCDGKSFCCANPFQQAFVWCCMLLCSIFIFL